MQVVNKLGVFAIRISVGSYIVMISDVHNCHGTFMMLKPMVCFCSVSDPRELFWIKENSTSSPSFSVTSNKNWGQVSQIYQLHVYQCNHQTQTGDMYHRSINYTCINVIIKHTLETRITDLSSTVKYMCIFLIVDSLIVDSLIVDSLIVDSLMLDSFIVDNLMVQFDCIQFYCGQFDCGQFDCRQFDGRQWDCGKCDG